MNKVKIAVYIMVLALILSVVLTGCSKGFVARSGDTSGASATTSTTISSVNKKVQSNNAGFVTIDIEWIGEENNTLVFNVAMNTHSVNLDDYDLSELAVLRDDAGNEFQPVSWDSSPGGHHRSGTLSFPSPGTLTQGSARYLEIVVHDIAGIPERVLKWEL